MVRVTNGVAAASFTLVVLFRSSPTPCALALSLPVAPEVSPSRLDRVSRLISVALGDDVDIDAGGGGMVGVGGGGLLEATSKDRRYASARSMAWEYGGATADGSPLAVGGSSSAMRSQPPMHELVYGELSVPVLATLLDAVGVRDGEKFLDIGAGDGALVLGASLLYSDGVGVEGAKGDNAIWKAYGIEIVPGLWERSQLHAGRMKDLIQGLDEGDPLRGMADTEFLLGDVMSEEFEGILADTTLAVCFATTWSAGNADTSKSPASNPRRKTSLMGRALPKLSSSLNRLPNGARVIIVDGKLDITDGFTWHGDLKIKCPDTAPYSVATLYERKS